MPQVFFLLVAVMLLAACGEQQEPLKASTMGCSSNMECLESERCVEGTCRPLPPGAEQTGDPIVEDDPVEDPIVVEDPAVEDPVEEDPVVEDPVVEDPVVEDPVVEDPVGEDAIDEDPVDEEPVEVPYTWGSDACVPAATEDKAVELPRLASTSASLAVDVSGRLCDGGTRELFLQTQVFRGDPVLALLTYDGDRDIDLAFKNGLSTGYQGFGVGYGQSFEIGSTRAPQEGNADPLDTESFLKVRAFSDLPDEGIDFRLQVRSGLPCQSDAGCGGTDACLRAYWSPRQDSQGTKRQMRPEELALPGACAAPLKPACEQPDADGLEQLGNDRQSAAKVVTFNANGFAPNDGKSCQFDEDWYRLTMPTTGDVALELWNNDGDGEPASFLVSAYDAAGNPLADMGYEAVAAGAKQADLVIPNKASGSTIYVRIVALSDNANGAYYLDFDVDQGTCANDAACAGDPNAARYGRTACNAGACVCPAGGCL